MLRLTGFGDRIAPGPAEQIGACKKLKLRWLELRTVWGKSALDLTDDESARFKTELSAAGIGLSALATGIGSGGIETALQSELERLRRAISIAGTLGARYLRIFTYKRNQDQESTARAEMTRRFAAFAAEAQAASVILLVENSAGCLGDTPEHLAEMLASLGSPYVRAAFNPAEFVRAGLAPADQCYEQLREFLEYVRIEDADRASGTRRTPGEGDGQIKELLAALGRDEYSGFLSVESPADRPDAETFSRAVEAVQAILSAADIPWE